MEQYHPMYRCKLCHTLLEDETSTVTDIDVHSFVASELSKPLKLHHCQLGGLGVMEFVGVRRIVSYIEYV